MWFWSIIEWIDNKGNVYDDFDKYIKENKINYDIKILEKQFQEKYGERIEDDRLLLFNEAEVMKQYPITDNITDEELEEKRDILRQFLHNKRKTKKRKKKLMI